MSKIYENGTKRYTFVLDESVPEEKKIMDFIGDKRIKNTVKKVFLGFIDSMENESNTKNIHNSLMLEVIHKMNMFFDVANGNQIVKPVKIDEVEPVLEEKNIETEQKKEVLSPVIEKKEPKMTEKEPEKVEIEEKPVIDDEILKKALSGLNF